LVKIISKFFCGDFLLEDYGARWKVGKLYTLVYVVGQGLLAISRLRLCILEFYNFCFGLFFVHSKFNTQVTKCYMSNVVWVNRLLGM